LKRSAACATRIIIVSDTHLAARAVEFRANWEIVQRWIEREAPDLVVHLGDISAAGEIQTEDLVVAADILNGVEFPLCALPGNHDVGDNPRLAGTDLDHARETGVTDSRLRAYRELFGEDYWSRALPGWQIIGLNAQLFGSGLTAEVTQQEWLLRELANGVGRVGIMIHKPLYRNGPEDQEAHERYLPRLARQQLLGHLRRRDVAFIVSGHTHQTRRHATQGIEHVWAPSTAFFIPDSHQEVIGDKVVGAMILDLHPHGHSFRLVVPDGLRQYDILDHGHVYPDLEIGHEPSKAG
jgi:3',5'-cyclic AMP phosphodiesterase CpdA